MSRTSAALIGCGHWGSILMKYLPKYFDVRFIADSKFDKSRIWSDPHVDAVVVATPPATHYEIVKAALLARKHVMCEKPLTLDAEQAYELVELSRRMNRVLIVDYVHTFSKGLRKAVEQVRGTGKVKKIVIKILKKGELKYEDVYWTLASHALSILSMFTSLETLSLEKRDRESIRGVVYEGEILFPLGRIHVSMKSPRKVYEVQVFGEKGFVKWSPQSDPAVVSECGQQRASFRFDESNNLDFAVRSFWECIEGERDSCDSNCVMSARVTSKLSMLSGS